MTPPALTAARPSLYSPDGQWLTCPDCGTRQEVWRFVELRRNPRFADATLPIVKCTRCRHVFAPHPLS